MVRINMSTENRLKCKYCKKVFTTRGNLQTHQKKAAYCIDIQEGRKAIDSKDALKMKVAEMCKLLEKKDAEISKLGTVLMQKDAELCKLGTVLMQKDAELCKLEARLSKHEDTLEARLSKYEDTIADIARQPRSTKINKIENTMNILSPMTTEHLREQARFLKIEHINEGMDGYARYALDYPLKNRVVCTDFSRRKIQYKDVDGKVVHDPDMKKLSQELFKAIRERNDELFKDYMTKLCNAVGEDPTQANQQILTDAIRLRSEVKKLEDGKKSEMSQIFVKTVCAGTTSSECLEITT